MSLTDEEHEELAELAVRFAARALRAGASPAAVTAFLQVIAELPWRVSQPEDAKVHP